MCTPIPSLVLQWVLDLFRIQLLPPTTWPLSLAPPPFDPARVYRTTLVCTCTCTCTQCTVAAHLLNLNIVFICLRMTDLCLWHVYV